MPPEAQLQQLVLLFQAGEYSQVEAQARRLVAEHPQLGLGWKILGLAVRSQGGRALEQFRRAAQLLAKDHESHLNLANTLMEDGAPEEAARSYRRALRLKPDDGQAHGGLGNALAALGKPGEALPCHRRAASLAPDSFWAQYNLGNTLRQLGKLPEAVAQYRRTVELAPDFAAAHYNLGNALQDLGEFTAAVASLRRAVELRPDYLDAHNNLGHVLRELGEHAEAQASFRRMLEIDPEELDARSNLLFTACLLPGQSPVRMLADAREFGERVARRAPAFSAWGNDPDPQRPLRLGFVSGDLRAHPVGYFTQAVFAQLAARAQGRLELHAYYNHSRADAVSARIKASCRGWRPVQGRSDADLAAAIRADGIDILFDLAGHSALNRLAMFGRKPAPVQVAWLGYLATTGVASMDYLLADPHTLPPAEEAYFTERIWRLPQTYVCFTAPEVDVPAGPLPALARGEVTFGCFNNLNKFNNPVLALWARVLAAVPRSRLFLKTRQLGDGAIRQTLLARFAAHGIGPERVLLEGFAPSRAQHLGAYQQVDIALDPFPYAGTTTSVEALWMGVPLLTLAGERFLGRQGVGLLANVGLPEWIAADEDDYLRRAQACAAGLEQLSELRAGLRARVVGSPLFDAGRFAQHFETAVRAMWHEWCGRPDNESKFLSPVA